MRIAWPVSIRGYIAPAAAALAVAALAGLTMLVVRDQPVIGLAVPALLLTALACARWPVGAVATILVFSGTYGSLQAFGVFSPGPLVDLLLGGLWLALLGGVVFSERKRPWWVWPGVALVSLYIVITLFEVPTAVNIELGLRSFRFSAWYLAALPLVALSGWSLKTYLGISKALIATTVLVAGYATVRLIIGPSAQEEEFALLGGGKYNVIDGDLALFGSFSSRHTLAFWVTCAAPFCLAAALTQRPRWRIAAAVAVGLCIAAALGTEVRAALPALVAGGATVVVLHQITGGLRSSAVGSTLLAAAAAVAVGGVLFSVVLGDSSQRYGAILSPSGDVAYEARLTKWELALEDVEDSPFGKGLGTAGRIQETGEGPYVTLGSFGIDSSYLKIIYEQGFPLLFLYAVAIIAILVGLVRHAGQARSPLVRGMVMGATGTLVAGSTMFVTGQYIEDLVSLMLWIPVAAAIGALAAERAGAGAPEQGASAPPSAALD